MSAEPSRKKAYSIDPRWQIVYQRLGMELPFFKKIAKNLNIATSTAHRISEIDGEVQVAQQGMRPEMRALDEHSELLIIGLILEKPNPLHYLDELIRMNWHQCLFLLQLSVGYWNTMDSQGKRLGKSQHRDATLCTFFVVHLWHSVPCLRGTCLCGLMRLVVMLEITCASLDVLSEVRLQQCIAY